MTISASNSTTTSSDVPYLVTLSGGPGAYQATVTIDGSVPTSPPPALTAPLSSFWSGAGDGARTVASFGVSNFAPPTGSALTLLQAIDAAVLATACLVGAEAFTDRDLIFAVGLAFATWLAAGGGTLVGGGGGQLQTTGSVLG